MLLPTMGNHGWLRCHFTNLWLTMVDHGLEKLCQTMVNHGWLWFKKSLPNHGQPWLTMVDWPTMVNHGRLLSIFFCLFSVKTPWPNHGQPNWGWYKYPLYLLKIGTKFHCWHEIALCKLECNDYTKANFKVCRPASKWVSVWSPYFCIDIFSGVRSQKLIQCESEIIKDLKLAYAMCNF